MHKKRIVIIGAGAAARMTAYILGLDPQNEIVGYTETDSAKWGQTLGGYPILGSDERLSDLKAQGVRHVAIGLGLPAPRAKLRALARELDLALVNAIHPTAIVTPDVMLGEGVVVLPGAILADDPRIGDNVFIGQGAVVGHGAVVGNDCLIGGRSAIGADVNVAERVLVGWAAIIERGRSIGADAVLATGACVLSDVPERAVMVGNPARVAKYAPA